MFIESIQYPFRDQKWLKKVLIGGILSILSFLIIPIFLVMGYFVWISRFALDDRRTLPKFERWGDLLSDGLEATIIILAYPTLSTPIFLMSGFVNSFETVLLLLGFIALLVSIYLLPLALCNYIRLSNLMRAFDTKDILTLGAEQAYFKCWLIAIGIAIVGYTVGGSLSFLLIGVFVNFYTGICLCYLFGRICSKIFVNHGMKPTKDPGSW